jgi:hypothetical protein
MTKANTSGTRAEGENADEVVDTTMQCGYNYLRLLLYAN